jgi:hypothetical protein
MPWKPLSSPKASAIRASSWQGELVEGGSNERCRQKKVHKAEEMGELTLFTRDPVELSSRSTSTKEVVVGGGDGRARRQWATAGQCGSTPRGNSSGRSICGQPAPHPSGILSSVRRHSGQFKPLVYKSWRLILYPELGSLTYHGFCCKVRVSKCPVCTKSR